LSKDPLPYATPATPPQQSAARQVFGVIVRSTGLVLALYGLYLLLAAVTSKLGMATDLTLPEENYFVYGVFWMLVGASLIKGGWLVRLAYGREE
jgi:hypothetical protein